MLVRTLRLGFFLLIVWVFVLGLRQGAFGSVIIPLSVIGVVFILQDFADRHLPGFSAKWRVALLLMTAVFTFRTSVWPQLTDYFRTTIAGIHLGQKTVDTQIGNWLNSCPATALQALSDYRVGSADADGLQLKKGLQNLLIKKKLGVFTEPDRRQEDELSAHFMRIVDKDKLWRDMIDKSCRDETKLASRAVPMEAPLSVSNSGSNAPARVSAVDAPPDRGSKPDVDASKNVGRTAVVAPRRFNRDPRIITGKTTTAFVIDRDKTNPRIEALKSDYDFLASRFRAIQTSLSDSAKDLSGLPIKPEIASAVEMTRLDLTAADKALSEGSAETASKRLDRVRSTLRYLESL